jgi:hypothetical protein
MLVALFPSLAPLRVLLPHFQESGPCAFFREDWFVGGGGVLGVLERPG